jgi:hypothetical protein
LGWLLAADVWALRSAAAGMGSFAAEKGRRRPKDGAGHENCGHTAYHRDDSYFPIRARGGSGVAVVRFWIPLVRGRLLTFLAACGRFVISPSSTMSVASLWWAHGPLCGAPAHTHTHTHTHTLSLRRLPACQDDMPLGTHTMTFVNGSHRTRGSDSLSSTQFATTAQQDASKLPLLQWHAKLGERAALCYLSFIWGGLLGSDRAAEVVLCWSSLADLRMRRRVPGDVIAFAGESVHNAATQVSRACPSYTWSILTEIHLRHTCSCHEILRMETPGAATQNCSSCLRLILGFAGENAVFDATVPSPLMPLADGQTHGAALHGPAFPLVLDDSAESSGAFHWVASETWCLCSPRV